MNPEDVKTLQTLLQEAATSVETELRLEDAGWTQLGTVTGDPILDIQRIMNLKQSRLYHAKDPLAHQAIRLWTDYTFGPGMSWNMEDESAKKKLEVFWKDPMNRNVLSAQGQRKSSDKLLVDGEVFFALFLGPNGTAIIRRVDPLEITEIISDPDDADATMYYRRQWSTRLGALQNGIYRS
ncbi:unnamed protein product, partial [marine sediment metagenome]